MVSRERSPHAATAQRTLTVLGFPDANRKNSNREVRTVRDRAVRESVLDREFFRMQTMEFTPFPDDASSEERRKLAGAVLIGYLQRLHLLESKQFITDTEKQLGARALQSINSMKEMVGQAVRNGATIVTTGLHIGGQHDAPGVTLGMWNDGREYVSTEALKDAYLHDYYCDLRNGTGEWIAPGTTTNSPNIPATVLTHIVFALHGSVTIASGKHALTVSPNDREPLAVDLDARVVPPIEGNAVVMRIPHAGQDA